MIKDMKYIVVAKLLRDKEYIISFSRDINHVQMFNAMRRLRFETLVSAGFINEFMGCYGHSQTLRVQSRKKEDTKLLHESFQIDDKTFSFRKD